MTTHIDANENEFVWVQKYRPQKVADTILPEHIKKLFLKYVENGDIPNLLLSGGPGVGKTTIARAMLDELDADYIIINGSLDGGVDTMRTKIKMFASTVSLMGGRKYVIIDEADNMTQAAQLGFRNLVEEFSANCGFILTCNYKYQIVEPIRNSRFKNIDFSFPHEEKNKLKAGFFKRIKQILDLENVEYDFKVVAQLIDTKFPDFRATLNELHSYSLTGKIDEGLFVNVTKDALSELFTMLKEKKFTDMRKWVGENSDLVDASLYSTIYDMSDKHVELKSLPNFIVYLGEYQWKSSQVADPAINFVCFLTTIMFECEFK